MVYAQTVQGEKVPKSDAKPVKSDQGRREELTKMLEQRKNELKQTSNTNSETKKPRERDQRGEESKRNNNREGRKE